MSAYDSWKLAYPKEWDEDEDAPDPDDYPEPDPED